MKDQPIKERIPLKKLDLMALMPCPLKVPFEGLIKEYIQDKQKIGGRELNVCIEGHANHHLTFYEELEQIESIDDLPEIIITPGINPLFHEPFKSQFIDTGNFMAIHPLEIDEGIKALGYMDPREYYTMFSMNLLVIVVNKDLLNGAELPSSFEDLLSEAYENNLIIRGQKDYYCETVLLNYEKLFGLQGIERLARSVKNAYHPSQMVKLIRSGSDEGAGAYIMPYFFAKSLEGIKHIEIIWPKEGALVNALSMLVKKDAKEVVKKLASYIVSDQVSAMCSLAFFPTLYKTETNYLKSLYWVGWDTIMEGDLKERIGKLNQVFHRVILRT